MKSASIKELKQELIQLPTDELIGLVLRLSKFKKENKELLTYLLYEASDEAAFIAGVKREMDVHFEQINVMSYYYIKKSVRKILREIKKYIRYSKKKETEVELLIYFCGKLINFRPTISHSTPLLNLYKRQKLAAQKAISTLHEDLQYDYQMELEAAIGGV